MVGDCLALLWLLPDVGDLLPLLGHIHGGGLLQQDGHLVHVWPGYGALPSTPGSYRDDLASSLRRVLGQVPDRLPEFLLLAAEHLGGQLLGQRRKYTILPLGRAWLRPPSPCSYRSNPDWVYHS